METFDDLGMPFPLFRAPVTQAIVDEAGSCIVCRQSVPIRFQEACYDCFRKGDVDHVVDTELGMVRTEDALNGITHGIPLIDPAELSDYELVPHPVAPDFPDQRWYSVRIEPRYLLELVRTPTYHTWQGDRWQFCCQRPCMFLGYVTAGALPVSDAPLVETLRSWFESPDWKSLEENDYGLTYYVFVCAACGSLRYHEDMD